MATVTSNTVENGIRTTVYDDGTVIKSKNEKPLSLYIAESKSALDVIKNPKTGKVFFVCGNTTGYISPSAVKAIDAGCDSNALRYSEVAVNSDKYVPTLMVKATNNVVRTFKA